MPSDAIYVEFLTIGNWLTIILPALHRLAKENPAHKPRCYIFDATSLAVHLAIVGKTRRISC